MGWRQACWHVLMHIQTPTMPVLQHHVCTVCFYMRIAAPNVLNFWFKLRIAVAGTSAAMQLALFLEFA